MNSKQISDNAKAYIISQIDGTGYGKELITDQEKVCFLRDCFQKEYGFMIGRVGECKALAEYFAGLPSSCTIAFYNDEILELAREWGETKATDQRILDNYFNFMANKTMQLFRKHCQ